MEYVNLKISKSDLRLIMGIRDEHSGHIVRDILIQSLAEHVDWKDDDPEA